jgi:hypothetical protein
MSDSVQQIEGFEMNETLIKDLTTLIRETARPQFLTNPVHGFTNLVSGSGQIIDIFWPPARFIASSIEGFCSAFKAWADRTDQSIEPSTATVAIGETAIAARFIAADDTTTAQVTLPKTNSACLKWLRQRSPGEGLIYQDQKDLIRQLRTIFPDRHSKQFATDLSNLKFKSDGEVNSNVQHGRESTSRSVEQKVAGNAGDLPSEITLSTTVNDLMPSLDPAWSHPVECVLHINMEEAKFAVIPKAGQIEAAIGAANTLIAKQIEDSLFEYLPKDMLNLRVLRDCAFN